MEATFSPELVGRLAGLDLIILGEGEKPLLEIASRLQAGEPLMGIESTAVPMLDGTVHRVHGYALAGDEFREAVLGTPYHEMPYRDYWDRLEKAGVRDQVKVLIGGAPVNDNVAREYGADGYAADASAAVALARNLAGVTA